MTMTTTRTTTIEMVPISHADKTLWIAAAALPRDRLSETFHRVICSAPRPDPDEKKRYLVDLDEVPEAVGQELSRATAWGYAQEQRGEGGRRVLEVDASLYELLIAAIRMLLEKIIGMLGGAGSPPQGPTLSKPKRGSRQLLIEHDDPGF